MHAPTRIERKTAFDAAKFWDPHSTPFRRLMHGHIENTLIFLIIVALLGLVLIVSAPQVHSQGVQLLKVDVAVVAKGYRMSKLIGSGVTNEKNEKIGTIDEIIADRNRVLFAVLQVGGFLGMGAHLVAVPYESLVIDETGKKIELPGASKDELKKLSEFKYGT